MGCLFLARAPAGRGLLGRGLHEAPGGAAGGPARGWAHVRVRRGGPGACAYGRRARGVSLCENQPAG
eukprot:1076032-Alexandrium_andersonii.AAC.1